MDMPITQFVVLKDPDTGTDAIYYLPGESNRGTEAVLRKVGFQDDPVSEPEAGRVRVTMGQLRGRTDEVWRGRYSMGGSLRMLPRHYHLPDKDFDQVIKVLQDAEFVKVDSPNDLNA